MRYRRRPAGAVDEVASATECTGLMPALPRTQAEADDLADLRDVQRPTEDDE